MLIRERLLNDWVVLLAPAFQNGLRDLVIPLFYLVNGAIRLRDSLELSFASRQISQLHLKAVSYRYKPKLEPLA